MNGLGLDAVTFEDGKRAERRAWQDAVAPMFADHGRVPSDLQPDQLRGMRFAKAPHCHDTPRPLRARAWAGIELGGIVLAGVSIFMLAAGTCGLTVGVFVRAYSFAAGEP